MLKRTNIAAGGTMLALGALAAVAVGASGGTPTASQPVKAPPPIVRTIVVHRTIRVVKHEKPKSKPVVNSSPVASPPPRPVYQAPATQVAQVRPVAVVTPKAKVQTRTSGAGGSGKGDDGEHEGGGDD